MIASQLTYRWRVTLARLGINLLSASRFYNGYWNQWRNDLFDFAEGKGIHILPTHYYTPIPTAIELGRRQRTNSLAGLSLNSGNGAKTAIELLNKYQNDIDQMLRGASGFNVRNSGFGPLDAAVLYGTIRESKPKRIIEIGSGMSTIVMLSAIQDSQLDTHLTCIEPYLPDYLSKRRDQVSRIVESPLQDVPLAEFDTLDAGDILFIDSTHVVKFNSDVVYEFLEILPRLRPGVVVHVHDIFLPNDYPHKWLNEHRFFWTEQYLLQAFLCMNRNFTVDIPLHAVKDQVYAAIPNLLVTPTEVGSLWMRRVSPE